MDSSLLVTSVEGLGVSPIVSEEARTFVLLGFASYYFTIENVAQPPLLVRRR